MPMTFTTASRVQHRYATYYTVYLVGPAGEREELGYTARKSGDGLLAVLRRESVQMRVSRFPGAREITLRKRRGRLEFSNGWAMEFGGTIRQESAA